MQVLNPNVVRAVDAVLDGGVKKNGVAPTTLTLTSRAIAKVGRIVAAAHRQSGVPPFPMDHVTRDHLRERLGHRLINLTPDGRAAAVALVQGRRYPRAASVRADAPAPARAIALGQSYLGYGTNDIATETAHQPMPYQGGPDSLECTQLVSWLLKRTGQIDQTFQIGDKLKEHALASGKWHAIEESEIRPGDVVRVVVPTDITDVRHTVICSRIDEDGTPVFLGANYANDRFDIQVVSETPKRPVDTVAWVIRYGSEPER